MSRTLSSRIADRLPSRAAAVRCVVGVVLLAAAGLKLYGLGVSAVPRVGWFAQPWVQLAAAEWELALGLWLLSGAYRVGAWAAALATFLAFAGVSGYLGTAGVASCGCFGTIHASPWWAFGVDVAALALLAVGFPAKSTRSSDDHATRSRFGLRWAGGLAVLVLLLSGASILAFGSVEAGIAHLRGESITVEERYIDLGSGRPGDLLEGQVVVRNWADHPVRLVGGTSDCTCTTLSDLPVTIEPGGSASIGIQLRVPDSKDGLLSRRAFVRTDQSGQPLVVFQIGCRVE